MDFCSRIFLKRLVLLLTVGPVAFAINLQSLTEKVDPCVPFEGVVDVSPRHRLDDDALETSIKGGSLPLVVALQGVCDYPEAGRLGVRVFVEIPYYDRDAEPPGTPDEPISDSDQFENVQLYFANEEDCDSKALNPRPCYRILEIRFNRFSQHRLRLRPRPHNLLRDTGLPAPTVLLDTAGLEQGDHSWRGNLTFEAELLPLNLTRIGVFVVDPTQPAGFPRYISTYRIYNHALSLVDLQVPTVYKVFSPEELANIVVAEENAQYSSYWDGLL